MIWENLPLGLEPRVCLPCYPAEEASLIIGEARITKRIREQVIKAHASKDLLEYLAEKNKWSRETLESVDWMGMEPALGSESHDMRVRTIKMQHKWLNVWAQRSKINPMRVRAAGSQQRGAFIW